MNPTVIGNLQWNAILTALTAVAGLWNGAKVHLYKNNLSPSAANLLADFTECDFSGYGASSAVVWGTPGYLADGTAVVIAADKVFAAASPLPVTNTAYGYYITDGAGTSLLFARKFDTPVQVNVPLQQLVVLPAYPAYGGSI